jgi:hypothetical protein
MRIYDKVIFKKLIQVFNILLYLIKYIYYKFQIYIDLRGNINDG